jgi:hypothetical protein
MSYTHKGKVLVARITVNELEFQLNNAKRELEKLLAECPHEWKDSPKGYEHEGKFCVICGVSELTIKR